MDKLTNILEGKEPTIELKVKGTTLKINVRKFEEALRKHLQIQEDLKLAEIPESEMREATRLALEEIFGKQLSERKVEPIISQIREKILKG